MGMYDDDEGYDDYEDQSGSGGSARDLRAQLKELGKKYKEATAENVKFREQFAKNTLSNVLQKKGFNPALSKFIIKDGVDAADAAAVDAWLEENGSLFGAAKQASEEQDESDTGAADQLTAMRNAEQNALPAGKMDEINRRIKESDGSPAAINKIVMGAGL